MGLPHAYHALTLGYRTALLSGLQPGYSQQTVLFSQGSVPAWTATERTYRHFSEWPAGFGKTACSDFSCHLQKQKTCSFLHSGPTGATPMCLNLRHKFQALYQMATYENASHGYGFWSHSFTTNVFLYQLQ